MNKFVLQLITEWRKLELPFEDDTIVVAVSGGADSLSLLLAIDELRNRKKLDLRIVAAHFNHKLRGRESDADEEFVTRIAAERVIELAVRRGSISSAGNLEQIARNARYAFLVETADALKAKWVLTAHTMNDQAETFLLNLIRGSGPDGLSGMRPVRAMRPEADAQPRAEQSRQGPSPPLLVRPLLRWAKREDTENFCRRSDVRFRYDTMNEDMSFKRVRVRKMLLPMLKEFNPKIVETLAKTAELLDERTAVFSAGTSADRGGPSFNEEGKSNYEAPSDQPETLAISDLKPLPRLILYETLRKWLKMRRGSLRSISLRHIEAIERLVNSQKSGRIVELPGKGTIRKHRGRLLFEKIKG
ncbi:MAG: tRNA lysidine(34) synthetase TilS [Pyrinomonadaceae bacterium]